MWCWLYQAQLIREQQKLREQEEERRRKEEEERIRKEEEAERLQEEKVNGSYTCTHFTTEHSSEQEFVTLISQRETTATFL